LSDPHTFLTRRKASVLAAADMRIAHSCCTRQAILAAMRDFSPKPNAARPIEQLQQAVGPQLLFLLHRVKIPIFVAWFDDLAASCLFYLFAPVPGRLRRKHYNFPALSCDVRFTVAFCGSGTVIERSSTKVKSAIEGTGYHLTNASDKQKGLNPSRSVHGVHGVCMFAQTAEHTPVETILEAHFFDKDP
jgi:hypothetical protein